MRKYANNNHKFFAIYSIIKIKTNMRCRFRIMWYRDSNAIFDGLIIVLPKQDYGLWMSISVPVRMDNINAM